MDQLWISSLISFAIFDDKVQHFFEQISDLLVFLIDFNFEIFNTAIRNICKFVDWKYRQAFLFKIQYVVMNTNIFLEPLGCCFKEILCKSLFFAHTPGNSCIIGVDIKLLNILALTFSINASNNCEINRRVIWNTFFLLSFIFWYLFIFLFFFFVPLFFFFYFLYFLFVILYW